MAATHELPATAGAGKDRFPQWDVRPGVVFPAWDHAVVPIAREAVSAIIRAFGIEKCWDGYGPAEDAVRVAVLRHFASTGRAPSYAALAAASGIGADRLPALLASLDRRDLLVLDPTTGEITGAYPFTESDTGHHVALDGTTLNAMCAVDALGTGAMLRTAVDISSHCRACGAAVEAAVADAGARVARVAPESAVVWSGVRYENDRAATSMCAVMTFFCSEGHLEEWRRATHPTVPGYRMTIEEARQVGAAIFAPMLEGTD